ncbi:MAG TPA: phospholipid carrier-dependent glycosyltransferase [Streptosporangiaceae bacterium]
MSMLTSARTAPRDDDPARPPSLRERFVPAMPGSRLWGWLGPLIVTALAGFLRFDRLGNPHAIVFDETYYAKDSAALLKFGVEHSTVGNADKLLLAGHTNIWTDGGSFIVHPQVGKWMIAVGEYFFGVTPFGWRFSAAVIGTLAVLLIARIARRMTRSTMLGCVAGLLLSLDGLEFVQSRTALLDIFLMFWILAAFGCLVIDRDQARAKLAVVMTPTIAQGAGPWLGVRWWRVLAGVCLGLACGVKWDGVYYIVAFGLLTVLWDLGARRAAGVRRWGDGWLLLDAIPAFVTLVPVALVVYVGSWWSWFRSSIGWDRNWGAQHPSAFGWIPDSIRSLWHYHAEILSFHTHLHDTHPYMSQPWQWLLLIRPVAYFYTSPKYGELGCHAQSCSRAILGQGTPAIWWAALLALVVMVVWWLMYRDWRAGAAVLGVAAGILPWFFFPSRTMFFFYALPALPFLVLALTLTIGLLIGRSSASPVRRAVGASIAGAYLLLVIANFGYMYPVYVAEVIPYTKWMHHMWFDSWI